MLNIDLMFLIPGKGAVEMTKEILFLQLLEFLAVIIITPGPLSAEEKPVSPPRADRVPLL
jgi:hypothetical protein